ncbi:MAG: DUF362 domain-containing protein [Syntrophales bacterium]|jgi:uncharacterized protein (DUF362 family)/Pyruvate/2-oxoacid:ferredoxin oxidoreductase delta subunit
MTKVILKKSTYHYDTVKTAFFETMDAIGGDLIRRGDRVLIKPNLLSPASPGDAVLTHPIIIKAAVEYVLQKGARPQVSDSPAIGSFEKIMKDSGIWDALAGLDVACRAFENSVRIDIGEPFNAIEMAEDAIKADVIINLPKLKTHSQMLLTLGVKNMFGCIVGYRKAEWHLRTGINRTMFAKLLVLIYQRIRPSFTILDGIMAMEGEGPGKSGRPRELGILLGGCDAFAVDRAVCRMLGLDADRLPTLRIAREMGIMEADIEIDGDLPIIHDFRLPPISALTYGPQKLQGFIRRNLLQRPVSHDLTCRMCAECWKICPAGAISLREEKLSFDYDLCIRCFCCIEVCPYGALHAKETFPGRLIRKVVARHF